MYTGELNGMTLTLPDEDYEILKKRLMVSKAMRGVDGWTIYEPCICGHKYPNCLGCPLGDDCTKYADLFADQSRIGFYSTFISWPRQDDEEARTVIKSMRKALLGMKKA